jgi:hypothetical protein
MASDTDGFDIELRDDAMRDLVKVRGELSIAIGCSGENGEVARGLQEGVD